AAEGPAVDEHLGALRSEIDEYPARLCLRLASLRFERRLGRGVVLSHQLVEVGTVRIGRPNGRRARFITRALCIRIRIGLPFVAFPGAQIRPDRPEGVPAGKPGEANRKEDSADTC